MSEWDDWAEAQRQRNFQKQQEKEQREAGKAEAEMIGGAIGGIIGFFIYLIGLAFIVLFFILKILFSFLVFLRNKFFIRWNWYVKIENAVYQGLMWIKKIAILGFGGFFYMVFILPFVLLFKWWELWLVVGAVLLYYCYGK